MTALLDALLAKPVGSTSAQRAGEGKTPRPTRVLEVGRSTATAEITETLAVNVNEGTARDYLAAEGQNPDDWEVTSMRRSEWDSATGERLQSCRFSFRRKPQDVGAGISHEEMDEMIVRVASDEGGGNRSPGGEAFVVFITDEQIGKLENADAVERIFGYIEQVVERLVDVCQHASIGDIVLAFGGDQCENFLSGGGTQVWRTSLTLTEQLRVARRLTLHAVRTLAPLTDRLVVTTCASNHGQAVRIGGKGETRIDDDHGIETLITVADACSTNPEAYGHVEFVVPDDDSGVTVWETHGTHMGLAHGHAWSKGQHWKWLGNAAISRYPIGHVDVLLAGHHHSLKVEEQSGVTFIQGPSCEAESTWWRNATNMSGFPGIVTFTTANGRVRNFEVIR